MNYLPWNQHSTRKWVVGGCWRTTFLFGKAYFSGLQYASFRSVDCKFETVQRFFLSLAIGHTVLHPLRFVGAICWRPIYYRRWFLCKNVPSKVILSPLPWHMPLFRTEKSGRFPTQVSKHLKVKQNIPKMSESKVFLNRSYSTIQLLGPIFLGMVGNDFTLGILDFGRHLGSFLSVFCWGFGIKILWFSGFGRISSQFWNRNIPSPMRQNKAHGTKSALWTRMLWFWWLGFFVAEDTRNFMQCFGKSMNGMEWQVDFFVWASSPALYKPCPLLTQKKS